MEKSQFFVFLFAVLIICSVAFSACSVSDLKEESTSSGTPESTVDIYDIDPIKISKEKADRIIDDYLEAYPPGESFKREKTKTIIAYFGIFNGYDVLFLRRFGAFDPMLTTSILLGDTHIIYSPSFEFLAYKDSEFFDLNDLYDNHVINDEDVSELKQLTKIFFKDDEIIRQAYEEDGESW